MTKILCVLVLFVSLAGSAFAESPDVYKMQADRDVQVAQELVAEANRMLMPPVDRQKMQAAMSLFARAGQMFEKSGKIYETLGPSYVAPEDVKNSFEAMNMCIRNIEEIKKRL